MRVGSQERQNNGIAMFMLYFPLTDELRMGFSCTIWDLSVLESQEVSVPFCKQSLEKHSHVTLPFPVFCMCAEYDVSPPLEGP